MINVTVIIPARNEEKKIGRAIESVLQQDYKVYEIIVVDDQSSDNTRTVVEGFANPIIKYVYNENRDPATVDAGSARNLGFSLATGDVISLLDADDYMDHTKIRKQVQAIEQGYDIVSTDLIIFTKDDLSDKKVMVCSETWDGIDERLNVFHAPCMFKKWVSEKVLYRNLYPYAEDYDWLLNVRDSGATYTHIKEPLYYYDVAKTSNLERLKSQVISTQQIREDRGRTPKVSLLTSHPEYCDVFFNHSFNDFEIINDINNARGKFIMIVNSPQDSSRIYRQLSYLESNPRHSAVGTFIKTKDGIFYHPTESPRIDNEIWRGNCPVDENTLMFRSQFKTYFSNDYYLFLSQLSTVGKLGNIPEPLVFIEDYKPAERVLESSRNESHNITKGVIDLVQVNVGNLSSFSGVQRYLKTLDEGLPSNIKIYHIDFLINDKDQKEFKIEKVKNGLRIIHGRGYPFEHMYDLIWDNLSDFSASRRLVFQSNCFNLDEFLTAAKKKFSCKTVFCLHCTPHRDQIGGKNHDNYVKVEKVFRDIEADFRPLIGNIYCLTATERVDRTICVSEVGIYYLQRIESKGQYSLIHNGVEDFGDRIVDNHDKFRWIWVGHGGKLKGLDQIIPVIGELEAARPGTFEVVWAGRTDETLLKMIAEHKAPIKSLGVVEPNALRNIYRTADGCLISSLAEMGPYSASEAMSAGLPIVATQSPGIFEAADGVAVFAPVTLEGVIDKDAYKAAMIQVMDSAELQKELSTAAKTRWRERFDSKVMCQKTANLYYKLF